MTTSRPLESIEQTVRVYRSIPGLALHTLIVYMLAVHISPMLVGRWFAWILPALHFHTSLASRDWYLQHLEFVTIVPALIAGYFNVARFVPAIVGGQVKETRREPAAVWVWIVPTLVLLYKMGRYQMPSSVLYEASQTAFRYFFEIERQMPRWADILSGNPSSDPVRVLAQMLVTAPFYAGLGYTAGALASKCQLIRRILASDDSGEPLLVGKVLGDTTPVPPSSLKD